ncbi:MAG: hypothetical protein AAFX08_02275 [Pseudomonadota bacterium]
MAVIIFVPGTGDSDTVGDGELRWWSAESSFSKQLSSYIAGYDKTVKLWLSWSGENSEIDRVEAAKKLEDGLKAICSRGGTDLVNDKSSKFGLKAFEEAQGELDAAGPIHIIAHSHGGNIVTEALRRMHADRYEKIQVDKSKCDEVFERLASWITVGTPFLHYKPRRYNHDYLKLLGRTFSGVFKVLGVILVLLLCAYSGFRLAEFAYNLTPLSNDLAFFESPDPTASDSKSDDEQLSSTNSALGLAVLFAYVLMGGIAYALYRRRTYRRNFPRDTGEISRFYVTTRSKWVNIFTKEDESLFGLMSVKKENRTGRLFGNTIISNLARNLAFVPGFMLGSAVYIYLLSLLVSTKFMKNTKDMLSDFSLTIFDIPISGSIIYTIFVLFFSVISVLFVFLIGFFVWDVARRFLSRSMTNFLDDQLWERIRSRILGDNSPDYTIVSVDRFPIGFENSNWRPLPAPVVNEMLRQTERHINTTVREIRRQLGLLMTVGLSEEAVQAVSEEFSFKELVHTSYFRSRFVQMMVAECIILADQKHPGSKSQDLARTPTFNKHKEEFELDEKPQDFLEYFEETRGDYLGVEGELDLTSAKRPLF